MLSQSLSSSYGFERLDAAPLVPLEDSTRVLASSFATPWRRGDELVLGGFAPICGLPQWTSPPSSDTPARGPSRNLPLVAVYARGNKTKHSRVGVSPLHDATPALCLAHHHDPTTARLSAKNSDHAPRQVSPRRLGSRSGFGG